MLNILIGFKIIFFKSCNFFIFAVNMLMKILKNKDFIYLKLKKKIFKKCLKKEKFIKVKILKNYKNKNFNKWQIFIQQWKVIFCF